MQLRDCGSSALLALAVHEVANFPAAAKGCYFRVMILRREPAAPGPAAHRTPETRGPRVRSSIGTLSEQGERERESQRD